MGRGRKERDKGGEIDHQVTGSLLNMHLLSDFFGVEVGV